MNPPAQPINTKVKHTGTDSDPNWWRLDLAHHYMTQKQETKGFEICGEILKDPSSAPLTIINCHACLATSNINSIEHAKTALILLDNLIKNGAEEEVPSDSQISGLRQVCNQAIDLAHDREVSNARRPGFGLGIWFPGWTDGQEYN